MDPAVGRTELEVGKVFADVVILTVLPEEYAAALSCLRDPCALRGSTEHPNTYAWQLGSIDSSLYGAPFTVAVGKGTATTCYGALAARHAIEVFAPQYIAFVGVGGGFPREGQRHGDVAVSSVVTGYEYGKLDGGGFSSRSDFTYRCDEGLVRAADGVIARGATWWRAEDNPKHSPRARIGAIASGDKLIDDPSQAFFAAVLAAWPKLLAVEMEGAGVAAAVHEAHAERRAPGFLLVRGICDMPHAKASGEGASTAERDAWKVIASCNAARFLAHLVDTSWPSPPRSRTKGGAPETSRREVEAAGLWRHAFDRVAPAVHGWLRHVGAVRTPPEYADITAYMRGLRGRLNQDIADRTKTYVPVHARTVPRAPGAADDGDDQFVRPIQQVIRVILGRSEGGDSASAELAAVNRRSRVVRNLMRSLRDADEPLVLLGDPGTGKSMTLQRTACAMIDAELRRVFPSLILYVPLGDFHVMGPVSQRHVLAHVRDTLPPEVQPWLDALDLAGRLVILFDGMDEMSRERYTEHTEALSAFAGSRHRGTRTLFSCRITDFSPRFTHRRYVLIPFGRGQILAYLGDYFRPRREIAIDGERWPLSRLARRLAQRELSVDASNPFVLWLLCHHLYAARRWPSSRIDLLRSFLEKNYQRKHAARARSARPDEPAWLPEAELEAMLAELAFLITERNLGRAIAVEEWLSRTGNEAEVTRAITAGRALGLLAESKDAHHVRFDHHRLQEYFTALHLCRAHSDVSWLEKLDIPRWQETMLNLVLLNHGDAAVQTLVRALGDAVDEKCQAWSDYDAELEQRRQDAEVQAAVPVPLVEPTLDPGEEILLADRTELAARIAREASEVPAVKQELLPPLRRAIEFLIEGGNPITQVKMMRASTHLADPELAAIVRQPLMSKIEWVRAQALILLAEGHPGVGVDIASEIGLDLVRGELLARLPSYVKAIGRSRQPGAAWSLGVALAASLVHLAFFVVLAGVIYWGMHGSEYARRTVDPLMTAPSSLRFAAAMIAAIAVSQSGPRGRRRGPAVLGAAVLLLSGEWFVPGLWHGDAMSLVWWLGALSVASVLLVLLYPELYALQFVAMFIAAVLYAACKRSPRSRDPGYGLRAMLAVWRVRNPFPRFWMAIAAQAILVSLEPLDTFLKGYPLLRDTLSEIFIVLFYAFCCVSVLVTIIAVIRDVRRSKSQTSWPEAVKRFAGGLVVVALGYLVLALAYYAGSFALTYHSQSTLVAAFIAAAGVGLLLLFQRMRWFYFSLRPRIYPPRSFTPEEWQRRVRSNSPARQAELIVRTDHQSIGVTPAGFLSVLDAIEPSIAAEPALSTYWQHRAELEQVLKQERQG